jgi:tyrosyl-tRNA synthetase
MYGKVMSVPDVAMGQYFRLVTRWTPGEISQVEKDLAEGHLHPRDVKMKLAREVVSIFHSDDAALEAENTFIRVFQQKDVPEEMAEYTLLPGQTVLDVLVDAKLPEGEMVKSKSEARRLIAQNGVRLDGETLADPNQAFPHAGVLQVGKRRFLKVV